jgi:phosphoribosylanthranilate isomerase
MKKINIISIIFALLLASCSLDYEPLDTYSDLTEGMSDDSVQVVFKDKAAVLSHRQTLTDLFKNGQEHWYLDMLLLAESHSDNAYAGSPNAETTPFEVNSIEGSNTNLRRDWNGHMGNIAQANKMINNVDLVTDASLTAAEKAQFKAEAKILRAMIYFDMVRIWGNVPLVITSAGDITSETIKDVYPAYFPPQVDALTIYKQIEEDLLEGLQSAPANDPSDKTKFTKSVARALLAKMYAEKPLRERAADNQLYAIQLHGSEPPWYCINLRLEGYKLIKSFGIDKDGHLPNAQLNAYEGKCDYYLFDTKTELHGGSGEKFNWSSLENYKGETPFILSGGISPEDADTIKSIQHPKFAGIDINSRFEHQPGIKNIEAIKNFIDKLR